MRVLVTRPEKEARATAARLVALGHDPLVDPVTRIVPVAELDLPVADWQAVTATSLNAVEVLAGDRRFAPLLPLPFFAVGDRTARAAREAGFADVRSASGDRRDLALALRTALDPAKGPVLWLVGRDRAGDLVAELAPDGFRVIAVEVYRAEPVERLGEASRAAFAAGEIDAVLVFSPRSAAILLRRLADCDFPAGSPDFAVHAISEAAARPFREAGWSRVFAAASPDTEAMLATLVVPSSSTDAKGPETRSLPMSPASQKDRTAETAAEDTATEASAASAPESASEAPAAESETAAPASRPAEAASETAFGESAGEPVSPEPVPDSAPVVPEPSVSEAPMEATRTARPKPRVVPIAEAEPLMPPPVAPAPQPIRRGLGVGGVLVATLLGGVLGTAGGYGLALQGLLPTGVGADGRVAALESAVATLKAQKPASAADTATSDRIAAVERQIATLKTSTPAAADAATAEKLAALENQVAGLTTAPAGAAPVDLTAIEARLAKLESALPAAPTADLAGLENRLTRLEAAPKPTVDLSAIEDRLARLEATPVPSLPADLAARLAALEAAAKARLEAVQTSVAGALAAIPAEGASKEALAEVAAQVDRAIGALRESSQAEIAGLKARIDRLGGGIDAETKGLIERSRTDARTLAARLSMDTSALADKLSALTTQTAEDLRKRNDDFAHTLTDRFGALLAASDAESRKRVDDVARSVGDKATALAAGLASELKTREAAVDQSLAKLRGDLDAATGRLGALETQNRDAGAAGQKLIDKVGEAAASAETRVGAVENRLAGIESQAETARRTQAEAVAVVALAELKSAVDAGRPFAKELATVKAAGSGIDLAPLDPFAATGLPSVRALVDGWPKARAAMLEAEEKKTAGDGVFERLLSHAASAVKVRSSGEATAGDLAGAVAPLEMRLKAGDLAGTLAAWKALPDDARAASGDWGKAVEARVGVDAALAAQTAALVSRLTQKSQ